MGYENKTIEVIEQLKNKRWQTRYNALRSLINLRDCSALEIVKKLLNEDENAHVREIAVEYLKLNDSFPLKPVNAQNVNLYSFPIKNFHTMIGVINVTSDPNLSENEAKEDIKYKLKHDAAQLGANAVININCGRKFLLFGPFKARGYAVLVNDSAEEVRVEKSDRVILLGILSIIYGLVSIWDSLLNSRFSPIGTLFLGFGLVIVTVYMFKIKQYHNDKLYLTIIAAIIIFMLILTYIQISLSNVRWWL